MLKIVVWKSTKTYQFTFRLGQKTIFFGILILTLFTDYAVKTPQKTWVNIYCLAFLAFRIEGWVEEHS